MPSTSTAPSWKDRRSAHRAQRRQRLAQRIAVPVRDDQRRDEAPPTAHHPVLAVAASMATHLGVIGLIAVPTPDVAHAPQDVTLVMVHNPVPVPEPEPEPEVEAAPKSKPAPKPRPTPEPEPEPMEAEAPEPSPDAPPPRRIVGLSMDSTTTGGTGPAYAIGNTRMGTTARTAADPDAVGARAPNRAAAAPPAPIGALVKPRRLGSVSLVYPPTLEAQGIEADVPLEVEIDASGTVVSVRITDDSVHPDFAEAARQAAMKQRFKPAKLAGNAIRYTLTYTVRFRITS